MMSKRKWVAAAALLAMSTGALADGIYEFDSITSLKIDASSVTGVLVNDTVPTTLTLTPATIQCFPWLELMMQQPGMFTLNVTVTTAAVGPGTSTQIRSCSLTAK